MRNKKSNSRNRSAKRTAAAVEKPLPKSDPLAAFIEQLLTGEKQIALWDSVVYEGLAFRHADDVTQHVIQVWLEKTAVAVFCNNGIVTVYKNGLPQERTIRQTVLDWFDAQLVLDCGEAIVLYIKKF
jgi:hypothetical protein